MRSSDGYHTFEVLLRLTQELADRLLKEFKEYRNRTGEIVIVEKKFSHDPHGRHYLIFYPGQFKGISWKIRFSNKGFCDENGERLTCSVKAVINPKILAGEKSYIIAANEGHLDEVERRFNEEAQKISPILKAFNQYSLTRVDYCINFDVSELSVGIPEDRREQLPQQIMQLIKRGDIPDHYSERYKNDNQFYLVSKSVVVNCYWKHMDLKDNFWDCPDLMESRNIIRFEVQFRYPKAYAAMNKIRQEHRQNLAKLATKAKDESGLDFNESDLPDVSTWKQFLEAIHSEEMKILRAMLSAERCEEAIDDYFNAVIKPGHYYTFNTARRMIEARVNSWEKVVRLVNALKLVIDCNGIAAAKETLQGKDLDEFRRSLRELGQLGINPVTIPPEMRLECIPNLLSDYYARRAQERLAEQNEKYQEQLIRDYFKDIRKKRFH